MPGVRLVTYNVHRFTSAGGAGQGPSGGSTVGSIIAHLKGLRPRPQVLALNEVSIADRPEALPALADALGMHYEFFGHVQGRYGNCLMTSLPILGKQEVLLRGGTEFSFPPGTRKLNGDVAQAGETHRIVRGLLVCDLDAGSGRTLRCAVTHLDHMSIDERETQLRHCMETLAPAAGAGASTVLLGDLNALTRADYSDTEWGRLVERAKANNWSPPAHGGDLGILAEHGFEDAFLAAADRPPHPAWLTASSADPMYRIDYCFVRSRTLKARASQVLRHANDSDHFPVVFDLEHSAGDAGAGSSL